MQRGKDTLEDKIEFLKFFPNPDIWLNNLKALYRKDMFLAQKLDELPYSDHIEIITAKNGEKTAQVLLNDGRKLLLHSRYNPREEARRFTRSLDLDNKFVFVIAGIGLGYHIEEIFENSSEETIVVVIEPDLYLIKAALWNIDLSYQIQNNQLIFIYSSNKADLHEKLNPLSATLTLGTQLAAYAYTREWNAEFHKEIRESFSDYLAFCKISFQTFLTNSRTTQQNVANNLIYYVCCPPIDIIRNRFENLPAVIVSAGPSLRKNVHLLKEFRDKIIIICVQTTLKMLLDMGIKPDFVTSLDWSPVSKRFFENIDDFDDIHLIAEPKVSEAVPDTFTGKKSLLKNDFADLCIGKLAKKRDGLRAGSTVAHLAFYLAEYIGANPIIFIGQDLAFTDNRYYAPGNPLHEIWQVELNRFYTLEMKEWERIVRHRPILRKVKDIKGNTIYTDEQMFSYIQQFERDFAQSRATVIDATEGGAMKRGTIVLTLKEALQNYAHSPIAEHLFEYRKKVNWFDRTPLPILKSELEKRLKEADEFKSFCNRTIKLLYKLTELLDNPKEFNKLIVKIDEIRTLVSEHDKIMKMVCDVSPIAEMRKFHYDKRIKSARLAGRERAARQLKRDISYVQSLSEGCDILKEILQNALLRVEEKLKEDQDG